MSDIINFTFRIKQISTLEFSIKNISGEISDNMDVFKFEVLPQLFIEPDNILGFITVINVYEQRENPVLICNLITRISFEIINFKDLLTPETPNLIKLPDLLSQTLLSISLSTSRGILAAKTEGTILKNVYLPVLNPTDFKAKPQIDNQIIDTESLKDRLK